MTSRAIRVTDSTSPHLFEAPPGSFPEASRDLTRLIKQAAGNIGFDFTVIAPCAPPPEATRFPEWLQNGDHGGMSWLAKHPERRMDPRLQWPPVKSILSAGISYYQPLPPDAPDPRDPSRGRFARYAWGLDYHDLLLPRLKMLSRAVDYLAGRTVASRAYVDTGPLLERPIAASAGAGFIGKHTLLIHWKHGSYYLIGELLLDLELPPDPPKEPLFGCRECHLCGAACPTGALETPYLNRANRCISYLTIEHHGAIPRELRPKMGNWVFGCDICQEACPYNAREQKRTRETWFEPLVPDWGAPKLLDLIRLDDHGFRKQFKGSAVRRTKRAGLLRNVAVALGNWGSDEAIPELARVMTGEPEPLIREHAAWALGRLAEFSTAREALVRARRTDAGETVRAEINLALQS